MAYVLIQYTGYEGHGPPVQVFDSREDALRTLHLAKEASYGSDWRVYQVPTYPSRADFTPELLQLATEPHG